MKNIILIAPPAAGKGTQSQLICDKYNIPHISTGDLLRKVSKEDSELGNLIREKMSSGSFVSDDIVIDMLINRVKEPDCQNGYILDGFPRNVSQAEKYLEMLEANNLDVGDVIYLDLPKDIVRKRIVGRLSCSNCGSVYNNEFDESKPLNEGLCDKCNISLSKREDDTEEVFEKRYETYIKETYPLVEFFENKGLLFRIENVLDKEFDEFLDAKADAIPLKQELALHFHVSGANETKREEIERAIKNNYKRELRALNRKLHKNTMFTLYMLGMALLALAIYIPLEIFKVPFPIPYIFDIIAWVFVWEATDSHFLERRNIQFKRLKKYRFVRADIKVFEYKPKKKTSKNFSKNVKTLNKMINKIADTNKNAKKESSQKKTMENR